VSDNSGEFNPIQVDSSEFNQNENKKSEAHGNSRKSLISMIIPDNSGLIFLMGVMLSFQKRQYLPPEAAWAWSPSCKRADALPRKSPTIWAYGRSFNSQADLAVFMVALVSQRWSW
jgi:hypothetical protein